MSAEYVLCYRRQDDHVETIECRSFASVMGHLTHVAADYETAWVRQNPGGNIVLVYEARGAMDRP